MYFIIDLKLNNERYYISVNEENLDELMDKLHNLQSCKEFEALKETLFQYDASLLDGETLEIYLSK